MKSWFKTVLAGVAVCALGRTGAAEVSRAQFSKADLDSMGYPTNLALAVELGRSEARRDLSNALVRMPMLGLPPPWAGEFDRILEEKYNVEPMGLAGYIVSGGLLSYADGYSSV